MKTLHPKPYTIQNRITVDMKEAAVSFDAIMSEMICMAKLYSAEIRITYHGLTVIIDPGASLDSVQKAYAAALRN